MKEVWGIFPRGPVGKIIERIIFQPSLGGGFKYSLFSPLKLGKIPILTSMLYFSKGLVQPPTRSFFEERAV